MTAQLNRESDDRGPRIDPALRVLRIAALLAMAGAVIWLCWNLVAPFVSGFTWGLTIAVVCAPLRNWLFRRMRHGPATILIIGAVLLLIAVPLSLVLGQFFQELVRAQESVGAWLHAENWKQSISQHRLFGPLWNWADREIGIASLAQQGTASLTRFIAPTVMKSAGFFAQSGVALFALFFFLRDQEVFLAALRRALPFSDGQTDFFMERISAAVRSAVYGRLFAGLLQGALGGVVFAIVGLPAPVFWGALMAFLSILPLLGAPVVWIPACLFLVFDDHWVKALIVAVWGVAVINPVDNILYPILVGGKLGLHPLALFVAF
ncbi:MAG: AI-2E family transporter, partial [Acidobacteriota bacterium]|nr:AI-2E family transporter [Acidobacteriota bacterium]